VQDFLSNLLTKMTWEQTKAKPAILFPDEEECNSILLSKTLDERLKYFEGGDRKIVAALRTLL